MGKSRKSSGGGNEEVEDLNASVVSWEDKVKYLSPISQPLATKKLTRKLYKTIKKGRHFIGLLLDQSCKRATQIGCLIIPTFLNFFAPRQARCFRDHIDDVKLL